MKPIVTLTLNPAIDEASEAEVIHPTRKVRTYNHRFDPGGGGINVARVVAELGRPAVAVYLAGGATGPVLDKLLAERGIETCPIPIKGDTRISHSVFERRTGQEYRFVPEGPAISPEEWRAAIAAIEKMDFDWLVASGSLPRGLSETSYVEIARLAERKGARLVLDTSGPALAASVAAGGITLLKPSLGEFQALVGREVEVTNGLEAEALALVRSGRVEILTITLGHRGALLATREGATRLMPPDVPARSATGAGDSFVGGMVYALAEGWSPSEAFVLATAAGSAAVLTPGTELCRREDVWCLHGLLTGQNDAAACGFTG